MLVGWVPSLPEGGGATGWMRRVARVRCSDGRIRQWPGMGAGSPASLAGVLLAKQKGRLWLGGVRWRG